MPIGDLGEADSARLIGERIGARVLPAELLAFCQERAGGHPLFLEELVRELLDSGSVVVEGGAVKARLEGATAVPRTLRTLIAARVGRLGAAERATLQAAAVLGDPVPLEVVAAMLGQSLAHVDRNVAALATRDLLRATGAAQAGFASPMHAEIVLDTIPAAAAASCTPAPRRPTAEPSATVASSTPSASPSTTTRPAIATPRPPSPRRRPVRARASGSSSRPSCSWDAGSSSVTSIVASRPSWRIGWRRWPRR